MVGWGGIVDRISYASDTFVTGTTIAKALLAYARDLAKNETSDTIELPVLGEDGKRTRTTLLIGPASQILSAPVDSDEPELEDAAFMAEIEGKHAKLKTTVVPSAQDGGTSRAVDEMELGI